MIVRSSTRSPRASRTADVLLDQRGATMVMGVFVAVFLVGMIYYVWGIGDAIVHRERLQDASDTASFSAAVIHARGMNMLALLNMIMAALAVAAATMASIATWIGAAAGIAGAICLGCGPWCVSCCEACPYAVIHGVEWSDADRRADRVEDAVEGLMEGLHGYAVGIRYGVPIAAQAKVVSYGLEVYSPVTTGGLMFPIREQLPAEDDPTNWPCDNKVWPWVAIFTPIGTFLDATRSRYLLMATPIGMGSTFFHSRDWCEDGYFQRVPPDYEMGGNEFQVQAYMLGDRDFEWTAEGVGIATWGEGRDAGSTYTQLAQMGRVSFAQAEFFYDDDEDDPREWLWHMSWRARLRRWRLAAAGAGGLLEACGSACGPLQTVEGAVVH